MDRPQGSTWEQGVEIRTVSSAGTADEILVLGVLADASQCLRRIDSFRTPAFDQTSG